MADGAAVRSETPRDAGVQAAASSAVAPLLCRVVDNRDIAASTTSTCRGSRAGSNSLRMADRSRRRISADGCWPRRNFRRHRSEAVREAGLADMGCSHGQGGGPLAVVELGR